MSNRLSDTKLVTVLSAAPVGRRRSSTRRGDDFEETMYAFFKEELERGALLVRPEYSKNFRKKGYYSNDRRGNIVFDLSIEVTRPGETQYAYLFLIECKDYGKSIPVDDIEEFHGKVAQVAGHNVKAIFASTTAFQKSARSVASAKKMGVLRYFTDATFKWELQRSPAASLTPGIAGDIAPISKALSTELFQAKTFDFFAEVGPVLTNSPWDFMAGLVGQDGVEESGAQFVLAVRPKSLTRVAYVERESIERAAEAALASIGYQNGAVSLDALCALEATRTGLQVVNADRPAGIPPSVLASISFDPPVISLFPQDMELGTRMRFTLAHELGHHRLGHGAYMRREFCEAEDFDRDEVPGLEVSDIARLEWQANQYAASLLMPRASFISAFRKHLAAQKISDRGFGALYLDHQSCNIQSFYVVANLLMMEFLVSKTAVRLRLAQLGFLVEGQRRRKTLAPFGSVMGSQGGYAW